MRVRALHPWDLTPAQARTLQTGLAGQVVRTTDLPAPVRLVAGVDLSPPDPAGQVRGAAVVLSYPALAVVEVATAEDRPAFPYVPGLLAFREAPVLLKALERLRRTPDLLLVDGQGYAHPRRFGLACHLGVLTGLPAIGCAKSRLLGAHRPVGPKRGAWAPLEQEGETIGAALRTRPGASPLYISVGHRVDLETAVHWALACAPRYRVPEPTRLAHLAAAGRGDLSAAASDAAPARAARGRPPAIMAPSEAQPRGPRLGGRS